MAAGSLVTRNLPSGTICAGRPAEPIGLFEDYEEKMRLWSDVVPWDSRTDSPEERMLKQEMAVWQQGLSFKKAAAAGKASCDLG